MKFVSGKLLTISIFPPKCLKVDKSHSEIPICCRKLKTREKSSTSTHLVTFRGHTFQHTIHFNPIYLNFCQK